MASECDAIVVSRLACRMHSESCEHCSFDKQYKYLQIVLLLTLQMTAFMRERTEYYVLPMQSTGYELGFDPVVIEPLRFRG